MLTTPADLHPNQVAFLGECESSAGGRSPGSAPRFVHALCWSRTPQAWAALTQSWTSMKAYRDEYTSSFKIHKGQPSSPSWVYATAPSLGALFRDNPAEESTLAAWISRAQISIAVAILHEESKAAKDSAGLRYRASVPECMIGYTEFLKLPGSQPCRVVLAAARAPDRSALLASAFKEAQERVRTSSSPEPMQLKLCAPGEDPLPLALTTLISVAVLRYLNDPSVGNPIYHAARPKLIRVPPAIGPQRYSRYRQARLS